MNSRKKVIIPFTLVDPCDPPVSVSDEPLTDQGDYTVSRSDFANYVHEEFTADPVYCPLVYTYEYPTTIAPGKTAITKTANDREFSFFYNEEIADYENTKETVKVIATSSSIYGATQTKSADGTWDLTFADPCLDVNTVVWGTEE